jgi:cellulose synthase/poly-beta-1,6-N-acetylglucosamine synthase-like glycosyltransferase
MIVLTVLLSIAGMACLLLASLLLLQVLSACVGAKASLNSTETRPRIAVLIPAHDEATGITATLQAILPQLAPGDRVIVVADNCTDDTADFARAAGAEVIVRTNAALRGKGYALDFGIAHLTADAPEVLMVIDADCLVDASFLTNLGSACHATAAPFQALNLMHAATDAGLKIRIAEFAWILKNQVRPLGYHVLGLPCHLTGTGMAFPWPVIKNAKLATGNITEDMQLGLDLAAAGFAPHFFPEALVTSQFPEAEAGVRSQRTRWEHGHLATILQTFPRTFTLGLKRRDTKLLFMALDLAIPPLALFALVLMSTTAASAALAWYGASSFPLALVVLSAAFFALAIFVAWFRWARHVVSLSELLTAPLYALSKLPIYLKFWTQRQKAWIRTDRK